MSRRPNILFVLTDQHVRNSIGAYGSRICRTPNLDRLAAEAVVFDNAYTACPVCSPARASIQTGLYPFRHGMQTNIFMHGCMVHELADGPSLLSRRLAAAGYAAGYTGKWHLGYGREAFADPYYIAHGEEIERFRDFIDYPREYRRASGLPTDVGYEGDDFPGHGAGGWAYPRFHDYLRHLGKGLATTPRGQFGHLVLSDEDTTVDWFLVERSKAIIEKLRRGDRPWFHMLNFWGPHEPWYPPRACYERYRETPIPPWESFHEDLSSKPRIHWAKRTEHDWAYFQDALRLYYASCAFIDAQIGRIFQYLKDAGLWDETVVLFSADHGDSMGVHGGLEDKSMHLYEETTAIPLIIRPAGGAATRREPRFANSTDLYSTLLDLAGAPQNVHRRHGRSLMPLVQGETPPDWPQDVVVESSGLGPALHSSRMIRHGRTKYVFNCADRDELYDLNDDPHELRDLACSAAHAATLRDMRGRLGDWMREKGDPLLMQYSNLLRGK